MIIKIEKFLQHDTISFVLFSSGIGYGNAEWIGEKPKLNQPYEVEFEIDEIFEFNNNIFESSKDLKNYIKLKDNNTTEFIADVMEYTDDNLIVIKICNSIIFLEIVTLPKIKLIKVFFTTDRVKVYPIDL